MLAQGGGGGSIMNTRTCVHACARAARAAGLLVLERPGEDLEDDRVGVLLYYACVPWLLNLLRASRERLNGQNLAFYWTGLNYSITENSITRRRPGA